MRPPASQEECLSGLDFGPLPGRESFEDSVVSQLRSAWQDLLAAFVYYCKVSDTSTADRAARIAQGGLRKLQKDAGLDTKLLPKLFSRCAGGIPLETATLNLTQFMSFVVQARARAARLPGYDSRSRRSGPA